jgi:heterodisulfide reductase subunit B
MGLKREDLTVDAHITQTDSALSKLDEITGGE